MKGADDCSLFFFAESVRKVTGVIKVTIQTNLLFDKSARQNHSKNTANSGGVFMLFGSSVCELCVTQKTNFKKTSHKYLFFNVIRLGFEPKTHSLEGCCSIQLSYRTIINVRSCKIKAILRIKKICRCLFNEKSGYPTPLFLIYSNYSKNVFL